MRAAVIHGPEQLYVEDVPVPDPGPGELVIQTLVASICNATDVHIWEGRLGEELRPPFPHVLGHERAGRVVAVGDGVQGYALGDRVACWAKMDGAFGEYDLIRPWQYPTVRLSDAISDDAASLMEVVGATMRGIHSAAIRPGDRVVVLGQGVQGMVLARLAQLVGAEAVLGIDALPFRLERARELAADHVLDPSGMTSARVTEAVRSAFGGECDVVIDALGGGASDGANVRDAALDALRWAGRYLVYGLPPDDVPLNLRLVAMKGLTLKGIDTPPHEVARLMGLGEHWVAEGKLPLERLITHRVPLEKIVDGLELCRSRPGEVLKVMVDM